MCLPANGRATNYDGMGVDLFVQNKALTTDRDSTDSISGGTDGCIVTKTGTLPTVPDCKFSNDLDKLARIRFDVETLRADTACPIEQPHAHAEATQCYPV